MRDFKSGGYDLEKTKLTEKRLISLIVLITLAYAQATFSGEILKNKELAKYVGRVKEKHRSFRRHSDFYLGLHGKDWIDCLETFSFEVQELMNL